MLHQRFRRLHLVQLLSSRNWMAAGDILQHTVLPEQLFPVAVHHDIGGGNVLELHMAECQAALPGIGWRISAGRKRRFPPGQRASRESIWWCRCRTLPPERPGSPFHFPHQRCLPCPGQCRTRSGRQIHAGQSGPASPRRRGFPLQSGSRCWRRRCKKVPALASWIRPSTRGMLPVNQNMYTASPLSSWGAF